MTTTAPTATAADAAAEFARTLPSERALRVVAGSAPATPAEVFEASHVGAVTLDVAVGFAEAGFLDAGDGLSAANLLHPALQAAGRVYGTGVLGEVRTREGAARDAGLLAEPDAEVFELRDADGVVGWLAIRARGAETRAAAWPSSDADRLSRISGVEMALTVEIGRTRMTVRDILNLEPGAVVELDRSAGAPADILLNGRIIAHGEVVVVDQDYAVRVTRILDAQDGAA
jgi:flagellar motor switch protein FliN/FliY